MKVYSLNALLVVALFVLTKAQSPSPVTIRPTNGPRLADDNRHDRPLRNRSPVAPQDTAASQRSPAPAVVTSTTLTPFTTPTTHAPNARRAPHASNRGNTAPTPPTPPPTVSPTRLPTPPPTGFPTSSPTPPTTAFPTQHPTQLPTGFPTSSPTTLCSQFNASVGSCYPG